MDLFSFLRTSTLYPKIYWSSRNSDTTIAAVGVFDGPTNRRAFTFRHFTPTDAVEWQDFPHALTITPRFEVIGRRSKQDLPQPQGPIVFKKESSHSSKSWKIQIEQALNAIGQKHFEKVVMAKRVSLFCSSTIDPLSLCQSLQGPHQTVFLFQPTPTSAFLGATPEMLYRRSNRKIECDALAGTRLLARQEELLTSEKDIREFSIVQNQILDVLSPLCQSPPQATARAIRTTPRLAHLYSQISAMIFDDVTDEQLIRTLHPTPAVGGYPRQNALSFIKATEPFARGLYAAPIGWTSDSDAEIAIGIRSCLIQGSTAHLFAGTGIVEGSDPMKEWDESEHKLSQLISLFYGEAV
ncbi:MAG: isochorismate synthase, chloroplastic [Parachlamydiales bacterium]|nr:isochorismate synthase, chloroplastic [Parachlamydiales bacterium]